jgi:hypothetical protein
MTKLVGQGKATALLVGLAGVESNRRSVWELHD